MPNNYQNDNKDKFKVLPGQVLVIAFETKTDFFQFQFGYYLSGNHRRVKRWKYF